MEIATLFESEEYRGEEFVIPLSELYPFTKACISEYCTRSGFEYDGDREITYNTCKISFYLNYAPSLRKHFLCFIPKNIWRYSSKTVLQPAFNGTVNFFKSLPEVLEINDIKFTKSKITGEIDISDWTFSTIPDIGINKIPDLSTTTKVKSIGQKLLDKRKKTISHKLLVIDAAGFVNQSKLNELVKIISPLFTEQPQIIINNDRLLESIETRSDKDRIFILFFGTSDAFEKYYGPYKEYFISNEIPSQFLTVDNYTRTTQWGIENLIFEIIKKSQKEDAILITSIPKIGVDGFLCLSDIESAKSGKLFGISVSFTGKGTTEDWLEIYNDIAYTTYKTSISFEDTALTKLSRKIEALSNLKGKCIDVYVTKRWKVRDVGYLTRELEKNDIKVRKFLHISTRTNRFLFSPLENESANLFKHNYILWNDRVASLQTNSKIQLYGTMFPVYIELLNPWTSDKLAETDLYTILWLTKKRIYRIMNFFNLRDPELLTLFNNVRKLNISNISGRLKISIHTLI